MTGTSRLAQISDKQFMAPDFLIIGTAKGGTTSVWYYLRQHPEIFMSAVKECHHFCAPDMSDAQKHPDNRYRPIEGKDDYAALFSEASSHQVKGEASPLYIYYPHTAKRICESIPDVKLIAILRNPVDRAFSAYVHMVRDGHEQLSFEDALEAESSRMHSPQFHPGFFYREWGFYYRQLCVYAHQFSPEQIRLIRFEDLKSDNATTLKEICSFLGVDSEFEFNSRTKMNVSGIPRWRWLNNYISNDLDRSRIFNVLKRPFPTDLWIRSVKFVQHLNYVRPVLNRSTRTMLMEQYEDDLLKLKDRFQFEVEPWLTTS